VLRIKLSKASIAEKSIIDNLSQFYLYEFSQYMSSIRLQDQSGLYSVLPDLDTYWGDPNRVPFILRVEEELAGLALVIKGVSDQPTRLANFRASEVWRQGGRKVRRPGTFRDVSGELANPPNVE